MLARTVAVTLSLLFCVALVVPAHPADTSPWRPFQLGFTETPANGFNIRVEDIQASSCPHPHPQSLIRFG
jgi:hypothetical protein